MSCLRRHLHLVPRLLDCIEVGLNLRGPQELNVDVVAQARQLCAVLVLFAAGTHELCPRYVNAATTTRRLASATTFRRGHWDGAMFILLRVWSNRPRKWRVTIQNRGPVTQNATCDPAADATASVVPCVRTVNKQTTCTCRGRADRPTFPELHTPAIHVDETRQCVLGGDPAAVRRARVAAEVDWKNDATGAISLERQRVTNQS